MKKYSIDFDKLAKLTGRVNTYWFSTEHVLLGCNQSAIDMMQKHQAIKRTDVIGHKFYELFDKENKHLAEDVIQENIEVIQLNAPKQFNNVLILPDLYKIKMVTIKAPFYDDHGKIAGVFGISHYLSEVSLADIKAFKFSTRETECLIHLLKGKTMREISEILDISLKTVGTYIERLKAKLNCTTRSALISKAIELGLQEDLLN